MAKKKRKLAVGDTIEIRKDHAAHIETLLCSFKDAQAGMQVMAGAVRNSSERLWSFIKDVYPETENFECALDSGKGILIQGRK